jgi:glycerol-3-phosphate dehydrogenase subunit C
VKIDPLPTAKPASDPGDPRFWDARDLEGELRRVFEICQGCRMCVNYCGAFPDVFARVDRDVETKQATGAEALTMEDFTSVTDHCWQCKLCYIKCPYTKDEEHPWAVDVPRLLMREKAQRARRNGVTLQDQVLGEPQLTGWLAAGLASPLANFVSQNRLTRKLAEKTLGIASEFPLPPAAAQAFPRWLDHHEPLPEAGTAGMVAIFSTCTGDYNFPSVPANAVRVLEKNGFSVVRPEQTCCGMPNLDGGDLEAMSAKAKANVASLLEQVLLGRKVVVVQPTCGYMLKKEYPELLGTEAARRVAENTVDVMELLDQLRREKKLNCDFKKSLGKVAYHAACHLRAQKMGVPGARVLALLPDTEVEVVEQCSAVDGTWGMKASFYEMGRGYAQRLTRGMDGVGAARFVSDCSLSALRILKENGTPAVHPVEALAEAYGISIATP